MTKMSSTNNDVTYVFDLPYQKRRELCRILDQTDRWEELGGEYMNCDVMTLETIRREMLCGRSPSDELLTLCGCKTYTVLELYLSLHKMQHYQAMLVLKPLIDVKYHPLIYNGKCNVDSIIEGSENNTDKDLHIAEANFDKGSNFNNNNFNEKHSEVTVKLLNESLN